MGKIIKEASCFHIILICQPIQVHVINSELPLVLVKQPVGWTGNILVFSNAQGYGSLLDKGGFSCTQAALEK